jgi:hypothetical protein
MKNYKTYKYNKKIICYIVKINNKFTVKTGKPSDNNCIAWDYDNEQQAIESALDYCDKVINKIF